MTDEMRERRARRLRLSGKTLPHPVPRGQRAEGRVPHSDPEHGNTDALSTAGTTFPFDSAHVRSGIRSCIQVHTPPSPQACRHRTSLQSASQSGPELLSTQVSCVCEPAGPGTGIQDHHIRTTKGEADQAHLARSLQAAKPALQDSIATARRSPSAAFHPPDAQPDLIPGRPLSPTAGTRCANLLLLSFDATHAQPALFEARSGQTNGLGLSYWVCWHRPHDRARHMHAGFAGDMPAMNHGPEQGVSPERAEEQRTASEA